MFLLRVANSLKKYKIPYAIVGGHAVAFHGAVRGTIDIDFITNWSLKNLRLIEKALAEINLTPRLPITPDDLFNFKEEYIRNKNLVAWNFININDPSEQIDVVITHDLKKESVKKIEVQGETINIISKSGLIKMKTISGRDQDLLDIEALKRIK